ncbi:MAG: hypothetical protein PHQ22_10455 [Sulfuricurvum sp.]|nr:hypothetical protein [Sulfuricurvum sp.]
MGWSAGRIAAALGTGGISELVGNMYGSTDTSGADAGITEAGKEMYQRGEMTDEEISQYLSSFGLGNYLSNYLTNELGQTQEEQYQSGGELNQALYAQTLKDAQNPEGPYISSLEPSLQAAEDYINRSAQSRGLLTSGIPIESMGRAGVELSVKDALARMQARESSLNRAGQLSEYMGNSRQNTLSNLSSLYGQQQSAGLSSRSRQAGQAQAAAGYTAYPYQAQLGDVYGRKSAQYALPGQLLQAGASLGGAAILACWVAKEVFGSWEHPKTVLARYYINNIGPKWFKKFYLTHGEKIAQFISNKPMLKICIRPLFELFAGITLFSVANKTEEQWD